MPGRVSAHPVGSIKAGSSDIDPVGPPWRYPISGPEGQSQFSSRSTLTLN